MNLELINKRLESSENQGLESFDPRFTDIAALVQEGDYASAAAQSESVLEEGIYDIRIIGYFLYGAFLEQGAGISAGIFQTISGLLGENWEALGPIKKRETHTQNTLNWFMKQLLKKLQYEEKKQGDEWRQWIETISSDNVQDAIDAADDLRRAIGMRLEDLAGPVLDGLTKITDWLRAFQQLVYREPEPEPDLVEPEIETEHEEILEQPKETMPMPDISLGALGIDSTLVEGSYHLKVLLKKLQAFERLITEKKFSRAAIAADDINESIANFDPKLYFPKIFAKFSFLMAMNIGKLLAFGEYRQTPEWQVFQELYKVDIDSFVAFNGDISFSESQSGGASDEAGMGYSNDENG